MRDWIVGSEFNTRPEVLEQFDFPPDVYVVDSTIRSLQSTVSGSVHDAGDLIAIGKAVDEVGVREQIINVSWYDGFEVIRGLKEAGVSSRLVGTFRARHPEWKTWATEAAAAGADEICPESLIDVQQAEVFSSLADALGVDVSHGFAERYEWSDVIQLIEACTDFGFRSQSFHDSYFGLGIAPEAMKSFIRSIREEVPHAPPLYVHLSNFFGQATMTGIAALTAGASAIDVCANATGHHCGHTSLPEVAVALRYLYGIDCGIDLSKLAGLSRLVENHSRVPVPLSRPVVGPYAFVQDGAYAAAEIDVPLSERVHATFPFMPDAVGSEERVVWTNRTLTTEALSVKLKALGFDPPQDVRDRIPSELDSRIIDGGYPGWLSDGEFDELIRSLISSDDS